MTKDETVGAHVAKLLDKRLCIDSEVDLLSTVPNDSGATFLRELLLVADHNAYHLGQWWCWHGCSARGKSDRETGGGPGW